MKEVEKAQKETEQAMANAAAAAAKLANAQKAAEMEKIALIKRAIWNSGKKEEKMKTD